jgi:hypothetical protein
MTAATRAFVAVVLAGAALGDFTVIFGAASRLVKCL